MFNKLLVKLINFTKLANVIDAAITEVIRRLVRLHITLNYERQMSNPSIAVDIEELLLEGESKDLLNIK